MEISGISILKIIFLISPLIMAGVCNMIFVKLRVLKTPCGSHGQWQGVGRR